VVVEEQACGGRLKREDCDVGEMRVKLENTNLNVCFRWLDR